MAVALAINLPKSPPESDDNESDTEIGRADQNLRTHVHVGTQIFKKSFYQSYDYKSLEQEIKRLAKERKIMLFLIVAFSSYQ